MGLEEKYKILCEIRNREDMINQSYNQLAGLGDHVAGGCLTQRQAEVFAKRTLRYIRCTEFEVSLLEKALLPTRI